jgi:hypothetical protein
MQSADTVIAQTIRGAGPGRLSANDLAQVCISAKANARFG